MKNYSFQKKSKIFDYIIVLADFVFGATMVEIATSIEYKSSESASAGLVSAVLVIFIIVGLYIAGIWKNRYQFTGEKRFSYNSFEWISLIFNSILIMVMLIVLSDALFNIDSVLVPVILISFIPMGLWIWLHLKIFRISKKNSASELSTKKIRGLFMIYPFVLITTLPSNLIIGSFLSDDGSIQLRKNIVLILLISFGAGILCWFLNYIPKKIMKSLAGISLKNNSFFWGLVISNFIKLMLFGFAEI